MGLLGHHAPVVVHRLWNRFVNLLAHESRKLFRRKNLSERFTRVFFLVCSVRTLLLYSCSLPTTADTHKLFQ